MSADPGREFEVEPAPERIEVQPKKGSKPRKKVKVVKSNSSKEMDRLKKRENDLKKLQRMQRSLDFKRVKKKATPKKKSVKKSPRRKVQRRKSMKKRRKKGTLF